MSKKVVDFINFYRGKVMKDEPGVGPEIVAYGHCSYCLQEVPDDESPASYARYHVGFTANGDFQVWCQRHNEQIVRLIGPFKGVI